jgi:hypothetical protein
MLAESFAFRDIEVIKHTQKTFRYIATHGHIYGTYTSRYMQQANHSDFWTYTLRTHAATLCSD